MEKPEETKSPHIEVIVDHGRLMNFSDAIFAFAATLLVLKIDLPGISEARMERVLHGCEFHMRFFESPYGRRVDFSGKLRIRRALCDRRCSGGVQQ